MTQSADSLLERALAASAVMLIGAPDTGKTTVARSIIQAAVARHLVVGYVDADVGQSTVGPPTCVGLRFIRREEDLDTIDHADRLRFVGSISPEGLVLQQVIATAALVDEARTHADLVVIDTTGAVSGVTGQSLKYHKTELCRPDLVVALQRGSEIEPIVGMLRRFFSAEVEVAAVPAGLMPVSPDERRALRTKRLAEAFPAPLPRWRVRSTVFAPTLPAGLDPARLDRMLVGVQDAHGECLGLGVLEAGEDGALRVITACGDDMRGLRLGSMRLDLETYETTRVRLREVMFGL